MRGEELLDILEQIDPALIRDADRKPRLPWLRWTAIAACLALLVGVGALFLPRLEPVPARTPLPMVDLVNHTVNPEKLTGVQILGSPVSGDSGSTGGVQHVPPRFQFAIHMVVEARVAEILPDEYTDALSRYPYRILRMETLEAVSGRNIPREFYLRLPWWMSPELDRFDTLLLSIKQVALENYMLVNQTTRTMEAFTMVFEVYNYYSPHYGSVVAFTDGVMDVSLWDLEGWGIGEDYCQKILEGDPYMRYPAKEGTTPEEAKQTVLGWIGDNQRFRVETQEDFPDNWVFDYVQPFENGVFAHVYYRDTAVRYFRLINGLQTSERILVVEGEVTREGEAFTPEDLESLPDLCGWMESLELDTIQQPHKERFEGRDVRLWKTGATGFYGKVDGRVYGVVKVTWEYLLNGFYDGTMSYYDALYYLVDDDGNARTASWEELRELFGNDPFLVEPASAEELDRVPFVKE